MDINPVDILIHIINILVLFVLLRLLIYKPVKKECDGQKYSFAYPLPAYGVAVFEY